MEAKFNEYFHLFEVDIKDIPLPDQFTFPFFYQPHPLTILAAEQLQKYLSKQYTWEHNFGLDKNKKGTPIGKMFGVLIVKTRSNKIGFLAAFSGKLANVIHVPGFVPSIFNMLDEGGFYKIEEANIHNITIQLEALEGDKAYNNQIKEISKLEDKKKREIKEAKQAFNTARRNRKQIRKIAKLELSDKDYNVLHEKHKTISLEQQHNIKWLEYNWNKNINDSKKLVVDKQKEISTLKTNRKQRSAALQQRLFDQYNFLNKNGEEKNVCDIFSEKFIDQPPAGAGECAAPKLLNHAYKHDLEPLALGEFWWGISPKSEVRRHGHFYPSCKRKCEPILNHMLIGLDVEENLLVSINSEAKIIETIYEDEELIIINKPSDLLSVPGKQVKDSVQTRMEEKFPDAKGHLIVHRLDMSTSGLMVIAKTKASHKALQALFINRLITKRYTALLDGVLEEIEGEITLPLRVDLDDRPRQLVCYEHGKPAKTIWKRIKIIDNRTLVHFYPLTGRTHQLRLHAAHASGLDIPILGDDLYGKSGERLHLHASFLKFEHPVTGKIMRFQSEADFSAL